MHICTHLLFRTLFYAGATAFFSGGHVACRVICRSFQYPVQIRQEATRGRGIACNVTRWEPHV